MAHNTRQRADLAAWANGSAVLNTEYDTFDQLLFESLNGDKGGIWLPTSKIIIGGANGLDVAAPFRALGASGYNASMQAQNWPERSKLSSVATAVNADVPIAFAPPGTLGTGGAGIIVCTVGDTTSKLSEDGSFWIDGVDSFGGDLTGLAYDIAYGVVGGSPGFLISSTANGTLDKSSDGANWAPVSGASVGTKAVLCYAAAPFDIWVAAGDAGTIHTSSDQGANWTARSTPGGWVAGCGGAKRVVWNGSTFVVLPRGPYDKCLVSSGGVVWTERSLGSTQTWTGLAYSTYENLWMAASAGTAIATSAAGTTWFGASTAQAANDLAVVNNLWVMPRAGGTFGGIAWSVDKGATWKPSVVGNHRVATAGWKRILATDNRFIVAHADGANLEFAMSLRSS